MTCYDISMKFSSLFTLFLALSIAVSLTDGAVSWRPAPRSLATAEVNAIYYLGNMMSCTTNRTLIQTLIDFAFYGCYCGVGGFGEPVDEVDRCCQVHDNCYEETDRRHGGACILNIIAYLVPYKFTPHDCDTPDAYITCADVHAYKWYDFMPECAAAICQCDREIAGCVARHPFHKENRFYNRLKCFRDHHTEYGRVVHKETEVV